jgi:hypothetical protein
MEFDMSRSFSRRCRHWAPPSSGLLAAKHDRFKAREMHSQLARDHAVQQLNRPLATLVPRASLPPAFLGSVGMHPMTRVVSAFLTSAEIETITGLKQKARQLRWLKENRWRAHANAHGDIIIDRRYYERRMIGELEAPPPIVEPNFEALRA